MRRAIATAAAAIAATFGACGSDEPTAVETTTTQALAEALPAIPDPDGKMVEPSPSGLSTPEKAWSVPDLGASGSDFVSEADARFLAATRSVVPYRSPEASISNATLIALGEGACNEAPTYEAGGVTVSGAAAGVVHEAALVAYC